MLVVTFAFAGAAVTGQAKLWLGMLAGATMALYVAIRDSPPWHIEKWRTGQEGERRTAKALKGLRGFEWEVWHDLFGRGGTNFDHVVMGPPGLFLLDSKNYSGEVSIQDAGLKIRRLGDAGEGYIDRGFLRRMRAASAELNELIQAGTGMRIWVEPVVVLWSSFPQEVVQTSGVTVLHGDSLSGWLLGRKGLDRSIDPKTVREFLDDVAASGAPGKASRAWTEAV